GNKAPHIMGTSANLLGFSLVVLTSIRIAKFSQASLIDESAAVACILLMGSCVLSFLSMRSTDTARAVRLENWADMVFLLALTCLTITIVLVSFNLL
ncbi:MAG: hypothetical protein EOO88_42215, partial [Pedobacter sp.]